MNMPIDRADVSLGEYQATFYNPETKQYTLMGRILREAGIPLKILSVTNSPANIEHKRLPKWMLDPENLSGQSDIFSILNHLSMADEDIQFIEKEISLIASERGLNISFFGKPKFKTLKYIEQ